MSGMIPSFLSSAKLVIKIGNQTMAYGTNLAFSDRMNTAPVAGIGSYNSDAIEPLQYSASGSFTITLYSQGAFDALKDAALRPSRSVNHTVAQKGSGDTTALRNGNSFLNANSFSPANLMISRTFDIDVYERVGTGAATNADWLLTYKVEDVRLTSYSMAFTPGSLVQETVGFMCLRIKDIALTTPATL